jgi:hypothetical protein
MVYPCALNAKVRVAKPYSELSSVRETVKALVRMPVLENLFGGLEKIERGQVCM